MPTTIYSVGAPGANAGNTGFSFRCDYVISGAVIGQIRVTSQASSAAVFSCSHHAIGVAATSPNTAATPVELLYGGASGFSISNSATIVSDWANLTALITDLLVDVKDCTSSDLPITGDVTHVNMFQKGATSSYNQASVTGFTSVGHFTNGVILIETQAAPGGGALKRNSSMDGLGASGGFFSNPLARSVLGWRPSIVTARRRLIVPRHDELRLAA